MEKQTEQGAKTVTSRGMKASRRKWDRETLRRGELQVDSPPNVLKSYRRYRSRELPELNPTALRFVSVKNH